VNSVFIPGFFWASLVATYAVGGTFWVIIDSLGIFYKYKIQPKRKPDAAAYYRVLKIFS